MSEIPRDVQRCFPRLILCIDVGTVLEQHLRHCCVTTYSSPVQRCPLEPIAGVHISTPLEKCLCFSNIALPGSSVQWRSVFLHATVDGFCHRLGDSAPHCVGIWRSHER